MFEFPNPFSMDALGRALILGLCGWVLIWRWAKKNAPQVTDATTQAATSKAIGLIGKWLK